MNSGESKQLSGMFWPSKEEKGRRVPGTLSLDGPDTTLHLWDEVDNHLDEMNGQSIKGILSNGKSITLLDCIVNKKITMRGGSIFYNYSIFPHLAIIGDWHITGEDTNISNISYILEDAPKVFRDFESFSMARGNSKTIGNIIQSFNPNKRIPIGEVPHIAYYTGKIEIFSIETVLGHIAARHSPTFRLGGDSDGVRIDNRIVLEISFSQPTNILDAISRAYKSIEFLGLIIGRVQNIDRMFVSRREERLPATCDVYPTMYPQYKHAKNGFGTRFHDVLIDAVRDSRQFAEVMQKWLDRDASWHISRLRLLDSWKDIRSYNVDRLVRVANMYDLLPESCFPKSIEIDESLSSAVIQAKKLFRELPKGLDRSNVLQALGRVGKLTLKRKIRYRARILAKLVGDHIPNIEDVIDEAVNYRNLYVHGTSTEIKNVKDPDTMIFLTDTLEFVFGASDLIDAGWHMENWIKNGPHPNHPFGSYLDNYAEELQKFNQLVNRL